MKPTILALALSVLGLSLLACEAGGTEAVSSSNFGHDSGEIGSITTGLQIHMTLDELASVSALIVKGVPVGRTTLEKKPATTSDYPASRVAIDRDLIHYVDKVTFRVDEYYKGDGPQTIPIMLDALSLLRPGKEISLEDGEAYVLFLFQPDTAEGRSYWNQGYLIQGLRQGVWTVEGNSAVRADGSRETVELARFSTTDR